MNGLAWSNREKHRHAKPTGEHRAKAQRTKAHPEVGLPLTRPFAVACDACARDTGRVVTYVLASWGLNCAPARQLPQSFFETMPRHIDQALETFGDRP